MLFVHSRPRPRRSADPNRRWRRPAAALLACAAVAVVTPAPASASPATIQRSFSNILFGPIDIILSPVVAVMTEVRNLRDIDDTRAVRIAYSVPGFFWLTGVQVGAGGLRIGTGILELVPGLVLWPFENTDLEPLYDPVDRADAILDWENPIHEDPVWLGYFPITMPVTLNVKLGVNYTTPAF